MATQGAAAILDSYSLPFYPWRSRTRDPRHNSIYRFLSPTNKHTFFHRRPRWTSNWLVLSHDPAAVCTALPMPTFRTSIWPPLMPLALVHRALEVYLGIFLALFLLVGACTRFFFPNRTCALALCFLFFTGRFFQHCTIHLRSRTLEWWHLLWLFTQLHGSFDAVHSLQSRKAANRSSTSLFGRAVFGNWLLSHCLLDSWPFRLLSRLRCGRCWNSNLIFRIFQSQRLREHRLTACRARRCGRWVAWLGLRSFQHFHNRRRLRRTRQHRQFGGAQTKFHPREHVGKHESTLQETLTLHQVGASWRTRVHGHLVMRLRVIFLCVTMLFAQRQHIGHVMQMLQTHPGLLWPFFRKDRQVIQALGVFWQRHQKTITQTIDFPKAIQCGMHVILHVLMELKPLLHFAYIQVVVLLVSNQTTQQAHCCLRRVLQTHSKKMMQKISQYYDPARASYTIQKSDVAKKNFKHCGYTHLPQKNPLPGYAVVKDGIPMTAKEV